MRIVNLAHPRSQTPPARRSEDPPQANYSSLRAYEAGRTAVVEPIAPQPTAEFAEALRVERPAVQAILKVVSIEQVRVKKKAGEAVESENPAVKK